jgi:hypothetical protein
MEKYLALIKYIIAAAIALLIYKKGKESEQLSKSKDDEALRRKYEKIEDTNIADDIYLVDNWVQHKNK